MCAVSRTSNEVIYVTFKSQPRAWFSVGSWGRRVRLCPGLDENTRSVEAFYDSQLVSMIVLVDHGSCNRNDRKMTSFSDEGVDHTCADFTLDELT